MKRTSLALGLAALTAFAVAGPASARTVKGCKIVANPTRTVHTSCPGANLRGVKMQGVNLNYANLEGANLSGANLAQAHFAHGHLHGVIARKANMVSVRFDGADLTAVDFTGAKISGTAMFGGADLSDSNLTNANLSSALMKTVNLSNATLTGANLWNVMSGNSTGVPAALPPSWKLAQGYLIGPSANLWYAQLTDMDLTGMDLSGANFTYATLTNVSFLGSTMDDMNMTGVTWQNVMCPSGQMAANGYNDGSPTAPVVGC